MGRIADLGLVGQPPRLSSSRGEIAVGWLQVLVLTSALAGQSQAPAGSTAGATKPAGSPATSPEKAPAKSRSTVARRSVPGLAAGPRVLTQAEMQRPRSPFLMPPSSGGAVADRYHP